VGYAPDTKLVIVHADDLGLARSVNDAFFAGFTSGCIRSGSAMVPCPHFAAVAEFAKGRLEGDIGLHLTLTSGPVSHRWKPTAATSSVPSLVDGEGYFHKHWTPQLQIDVRHVEIELRAQIEHAYTFGLRPTHLDSHHFLLQLKARDFFEVYLKLGRQYRLPVLVARGWFTRFPFLSASLSAEDAVLDEVVTIGPNVAQKQWPAFYRRALETLRPGITEFVIHPGFDNEELQAFYDGHLPWGAAWRQRDFDFFTSDEFRYLLVKHDIKLITWREIAARLT
jgi:hypothetical protein